MLLRSEIIEKLKKYRNRSHHGKVGSKIASLIMSAMLVVSASGLAACSMSCSSCAPNQPSKPPIVNPDNGNQNGGNQNGDNQNGNNQGNGNQNGNNQNTVQYSAILNTVLTDSYYTNLVDKAKNKQTLAPNTFYGNPYGFLKQQGYDVNTILNNNQYYCRSTSYWDEEDKCLYTRTYVATNSQNKYYDLYLLKYTLTNQEKQDLDMLFSHNYYQAPLFLQELSHQKTATVVASSKMTAQAYNKLTTELARKFGEYIGDSSYCTPFLVDCSADGSGEQFYIYSYNATLGAYSSNPSKMAVLNTISTNIEWDNGYYASPYLRGDFMLDGDVQVKDIVTYNTSHININAFIHADLEA